jgi:hypothetical protein
MTFCTPVFERFSKNREKSGKKWIIFQSLPTVKIGKIYDTSKKQRNNGLQRPVETTF